MATTTETFTATGTWHCPDGVTSITVEAYGGGGAGGAGTGNPASGGGGAGGAYAKKATYAVVPGTTYTVTVGATKTTLTTNTQAQNKGNDSWFSSNDTNGVVAEGGLGGNPATTNSSNGALAAGSSAASFGDGGAVFKGGDGAAGAFGTKGGAGGGGAGSTGNGGSGGVATGVGGAGTSNNTAGTGGTGPSPGAIGGNGVAWGGGGAGGIASTATDRVGGSGANGAVVLTWTNPLAEKFTENWVTNSIRQVWNDWGFPQESAATGQIVITQPSSNTTYHGIDSFGDTTTAVFHPVDYNMTGSFCVNQLVSAGNQALASFEVYPLLITVEDGVFNSNLHWMINTNTVNARYSVTGVTTSLGSFSYVAATHNWFRIRESGGTTFWDWSTDGVTWTNFASHANLFTMTAMRLGMQVGTFSSEASSTTATFDNFNVPPSGNECFQPTGQPTIHHNAGWMSV